MLPAGAPSQHGSTCPARLINGTKHQQPGSDQDRDKVFVTKKNAQLDYEVPNSLASKYVLERSDAAKGLDSRLAPPKELYGGVYVLGYDRVLEIITGLEGQLDQLKGSLEWMAPFRRSD
jgi:hypothetical protein